MTEREKVIRAYECTDVIPDQRCSECPYGYGYLDNSGDGQPFWWCNHDKLMKDAIDYLLKAQDDVVKVVRCKDCKWWWAENELCTHERHLDGNVCCHECNAEDYCSDGERRVNND